jgi:hypothetical protein
MKKIILFLLLLISINASAQKIHFTDTSNVWKQVFCLYNDWYPPLISFDTYHYVRDTMIHSVNYKIFNFDNYCSPNGHGAGSFIREDTIMKKIFIRDVAHDSDIVLIDYNIVVGDTFKIYNPYSNNFKYYPVTSIDSTLIGGTWYKVWHFPPFLDSRGNMNLNSDIIEGMGCVQHPTYLQWDGGVEPPGVSVYCFSNRGNTPVISPAVSSLDNTTSCITTPHLAQNTIAKTQKISISPNPTYNEITINAGEIIKEAILTSISGSVVLHIKPNSKQITLSIAPLPAGLYFAEVRYGDDGQGRYVGKVVKE